MVVVDGEKVWGAGALTFLSDGRSRGRCPTGPAHALCYTAEPSQGLDRPGIGLSLVSPLGMQRKMTSEGYRTAWSIRPALGNQEQLGPYFEGRNRPFHVY